MGGFRIRRWQLCRTYGISAGKSAKRYIVVVGGVSQIAELALTGPKVPQAKIGRMGMGGVIAWEVGVFRGRSAEMVTT